MSAQTTEHFQLFEESYVDEHAVVAFALAGILAVVASSGSAYVACTCGTRVTRSCCSFSCSRDTSAQFFGHLDPKSAAWKRSCPNLVLFATFETPTLRNAPVSSDRSISGALAVFGLSVFEV